VIDAIVAQDIGSLAEAITVDLSPRPVKTTVQLTVFFAIER